MAKILVVDDEAGIRDFLNDALTDAGHEVAEAGDVDEAMIRLEEQPFELVIVDLNMPGDRGGLDVLRRVRAEWRETQVVVLTAHGTVETAVEAMRLGAFDFLEKPIAGPVELRRLVLRALNWRTARVPTPPPVEVTPLVAEAAPAIANPRSPLRRFLGELKRRHVYNVSAAYAAICFVALQSAELLLPVLPVPDWAYTLLVAVAIAGFPVALVLGWIYDLTASGWRRSPAMNDE